MDPVTTARTYENLIERIQKDFPNVTSLSDQNDNATNFRNSVMLSARRHISVTTGLTITDTHNSEPQNGKDECDRAIAVIKPKILNYVNSGNNVLTAEDMKHAILSAPAMPHVKVAVYDCSYPPRAKKVAAAPGFRITTLHSFVYEEQGVRVFRHFGVGSGKLVPYFQLPTMENQHSCLETVSDFDDAPIGRPTSLAAGFQAPKSDAVLCCPHEGCHQRFRVVAVYEKHIMDGAHDVEKPETSADKVKKLWFGAQESVKARTIFRTAEIEPASYSVESTDLKLGFALQVRKPAHRMSAKQKKYLQNIYYQGETTSSKAAASDVAEMIRRATNEDGVKLFSASEYLEKSAILNYFAGLSRINKSQGVPSTLVDEIMADADANQAAENDAVAVAFQSANFYQDLLEQARSVDNTTNFELGDVVCVKQAGRKVAAIICSMKPSPLRVEIRPLRSIPESIKDMHSGIRRFCPTTNPVAVELSDNLYVVPSAMSGGTVEMESIHCGDFKFKMPVVSTSQDLTDRKRSRESGASILINGIINSSTSGGLIRPKQHRTCAAIEEAVEVDNAPTCSYDITEEQVQHAISSRRTVHTALVHRSNP